MSRKKLDKFVGQFRVGARGKTGIGGEKASDKCGFRDREWACQQLAAEHELLKQLQVRLFAGGRKALLVVFQAMDTGGKDGTIRKVLGPLNPQGVEVTGFKKPTPEELAHDYLWRIHRAAPRKGMIGVFNRSHYEDVLVVRVHGWAPGKVIERRYDEINRFEKHLADNGTGIVKICLNITRDEQKERLQARLDEPDKNWKFDVGDLAERKLWPKYMKAYDTALRRCSTPWAPWYLVPANRKWVRNLVVARIVRHALEGMKLKYPPAPDGLKDVVIT